MPRLIRLAALVGMSVAGVTAAHSLPITSDPWSGWTLDGALRSTLSPTPLNARPSWTGFYAGVNAGGVWDGSTVADMVGAPALPQADFMAGDVVTGSVTGTSGGFLGGAQLGYDFQWPFGLVTGLEGDFQGVTLRSSGTLTTILPMAFGAVNASNGADYLGTVRLRFGYQIVPGLLTYATGGFAYGQVGFKTNSSVIAFDFPGNPVVGAASLANFQSSRVGWAFGGGVEFPIVSNLSAKIEVLRFDLGTGYIQTPFVSTVDASLWPAIAQKSAVHFTGNVARVGLNYRFNGDAPISPILPVMAKY